MLHIESLPELTRRARTAASALAITSSDARNAALVALADGLESDTETVLEANGLDVEDAQASGMDPVMIDRLLLTTARMHGLSADVRRIAQLPDPVGEFFDVKLLANGLELSKRRVPLGVIGVVYESRPNVTIDVAALCLKSGNAVILRGGKEARRSNAALARCIARALLKAGLSTDTVQTVGDPDRAIVGDMIKMRGEIDLLIPRGGKALIEFVRENAQVPVVAGGLGVCHTYVHSDADLEKALEIVHNAKTRRPSVCNALDTVLVHATVAPRFLQALAERWSDYPVEIRGCERTMEILSDAGTAGPWKPAAADDFGREFLSLTAAVRVVDSLDEAVHHIEHFGSGHSEAIVTEGYSASREFVHRIDAAAVYVNASTGFTDGGEFGMGAEIGISTQKFHARGPLGLRELTSYKWVVLGNGQTRP